MTLQLQHLHQEIHLHLHCHLAHWTRRFIWLLDHLGDCIHTFYTLASLELIAESIEDPFGLDTD